MKAYISSDYFRLTSAIIAFRCGVCIVRTWSQRFPLVDHLSHFDYSHTGTILCTYAACDHIPDDVTNHQVPLHTNTYHFTLTAQYTTVLFHAGDYNFDVNMFPEPTFNISQACNWTQSTV